MPAVVSVFANLTFTSNRIQGRVQVLYKHVRGRWFWPEMLTIQKFGIEIFRKFNTRFKLKFSRINQAIFCCFCLIKRPKITARSEKFDQRFSLILILFYWGVYSGPAPIIFWGNIPQGQHFIHFCLLSLLITGPI